MLKSGRLLLVQSVLMAMSLHAMLALDILQKTIAQMNKICRGFLWCAKEQAQGGHCVVAWSVVCAPKWAGGLAVPNLRWLNKAMQAHWPWLQRSDPSRPWTEFKMSVPEEAMQIFRAATCVRLGNGRSARFWEDRWLGGWRVQELAPNISARVKSKARRERFVRQAILSGE